MLDVKIACTSRRCSANGLNTKGIVGRGNTLDNTFDTLGFFAPPKRPSTAPISNFRNRIAIQESPSLTSFIRTGTRPAARANAAAKAVVKGSSVRLAISSHGPVLGSCPSISPNRHTDIYLVNSFTSPARFAPRPPSTAPRPSSSRGRLSTPVSRFPVLPSSTLPRSSSTL